METTTSQKIWGVLIRVEIGRSLVYADDIERLLRALTLFEANWEVLRIHIPTHPPFLNRWTPLRLSTTNRGTEWEPRYGDLAKALKAERIRYETRAVRIHRMEISSPGFISVEGGQALEKLVEILHRGDLAREEKTAIIDRIRAETRQIHADALTKELTAMGHAVEVLQDLGYEKSEIRKMLLDGEFARLVGMPLLEIEALKDSGIVEEVEIVKPIEE